MAGMEEKWMMTNGKKIRMHFGKWPYLEKYYPKEKWKDAFHEAWLLQRLDYPGIPKLLDFALMGNDAVIRMELVGRETIGSLCRKKKMADYDVVMAGIQMCDILSYLHGMKPYPILHLDIQPDNIMAGENRIYLIDFEYAVWDINGRFSRCMMGTKGFAAPEQLSRNGHVSEESDLYQTASLLWYMVTEKIESARHLRESEGNDSLFKIKEEPIRALLEILSLCMDRRRSNGRIRTVSELKEKLMNLTEFGLF